MEDQKELFLANGVFVRDALDLINDKNNQVKIYIKLLDKAEAEIDRLTKVEKSHQELNGELRKEVERLSKHNGKCIYLSDDETTEYCVEAICPKFKTEKQIRAEAIKEVFEKVEATTWYHTNAKGGLAVGANGETNVPLYKAEDIYKIAKEMGVEL